MGILNGREGYDFPMTASMLVMRHSLVVAMQLWVMLVSEKERVCSLKLERLSFANKGAFPV